MMIFKTQTFLAATLSVWMASQPVVAALAPASSDMDASAAGAGDEAASAGNSTVNLSDAGTQKSAVMMLRGLSLPRSAISMDFQDADVRDVLHLLALKSGLNVIYGADVTGPVTVHLDHVPFDQAFETVLTLKGLVALPMGPRIIRVVSSTGLSTEQSQAATFTRVFRLNYANAEELKRPVDAIRAAAGRKGVTSVDAKTNSLIITDTQEGLKEVEDLIPTLDRKPQQVDIESKIVEVTLNNETDTGISWQYAANVKTPDAGNSTPNVGIGATQVQTGSTNGGGLFSSPNATVVTPLSFLNGGTGVNLMNVQEAGFSFVSRAGTYLLAAQIAALATQQRAKVLSSPHIVTMNNEEAKIDVASQIPYSVTTVSNGVSQESVQFISAGVKLTVKPTINADRRITLKVRPEVSDAPGGNIGNLPPTVLSRDADTTVVLRDGETIAIGGLIKDSVTKTVKGVPILMSIPILGYLFKQTADVKNRDELIVFLTPRIAAE